jgi:hypothetical protein
MAKIGVNKPMRRGRPSKYDPAFGEHIVAWMKRGYSLAAACGAVGLPRRTAYSWIGRHAEFLHSIEVGKAMRTFALERDLLSSTEGPVIRARRFALVNAAPEEWRNQQDMTVTPSRSDVWAEIYRSLAGTALRPKDPSSPERP